MSIASTLLDDLRLLIKETKRLTLLAHFPYGEVLKGRSRGYGEVYEELLLLRSLSDTETGERQALIGTVVALRERLQAARLELSMFQQNIETLRPLSVKNWSLRSYLNQEIQKALAGEGRIEILRNWTKMLEEDAARMQVALPPLILKEQAEPRPQIQQSVREWLEVVSRHPGETICIAQYRRENGSYELSLRDQTYTPGEMLRLLNILDMYRPMIEAAIDQR